MKNIVIQGIGFVGSAMAVAIASSLDRNGKSLFHVIGVDRNNQLGLERIKSINSGRFPFNTNDDKLTSELKKSIERGNLKATNDTNVYATADIVLVSINCDLVNENGQDKIALSAFINSICEIAKNISENTLVIIESTVPPGTCEKIVYPLFEEIFNKRKLNINKFYLAHSYERVMPGDAYFDSIVNYWRVYAGIDEESADRCEDFLSQLIYTTDYPLTRLSNTTASETGKLLENSYRAVNIAFIEEWGRFAEEVGIDLYEVIDAIRMRPTHANIRQPGFGVGGYCLTKDPLFAKISAKDIFQLIGHEFQFSTKAIQVNARMPLVTLNKLKHYFNGTLLGKKILLLGATYRQDVGDTRFSPSEIFVKEAKTEGAIISVYDPMIIKWDELNIETEGQLPDSTGFDAILFAVPHKEFANISFNDWISQKNTLLFDANNVLTKEQISEIKQNNLNYMSIGRG